MRYGILESMAEVTSADAAVLLGKCVIIVEDDPFLHNLLADYLQVLRDQGVNVDIAFNGDEAIAHIHDLNPDLVILDVVLPGMNGFEVLEKIRAEEAYKELPVIVLSNLNQQKDLDRAKALGVSEYLIKANFALTDLAAKIQEILKKQGPKQSA